MCYVYKELRYGGGRSEKGRESIRVDGVWKGIGVKYWWF